MNLNRTIKLTKPIRKEIAENCRLKWMVQNPRPKCPPPVSGDQLKTLMQWKESRDVIEQQCMNALETFTSVNQLSDLWPEILPFVPGYLVNPSKEFQLP